MRLTSPTLIINEWLSKSLNQYYSEPNRMNIASGMQDSFQHYSHDDAANAVEATIQMVDEDHILRGLGVIGAIALSVKDMLIEDRNHICVCKHKSLINYRMLTHRIGPSIFNAAFLAYNDIRMGYKRESYTIPPVIHTDNARLHGILKNGIAENHFHIGGSSHAFLSSWVCLMNHMSHGRRNEFIKSGIDVNPLDEIDNFSMRKESAFSLTFKAAYIRLFLFFRLKGTWLTVYDNNSHTKEAESEIQLERVLRFSEEECVAFAPEFDNYIESLKECFCMSEYDYAVPGEKYKNNLAKDAYAALPDAVKKNERRIYQYLSGEQYFLYEMFRHIYIKDNKISPYTGLFYAYLLIGCKLRSELVQTNNRVGFQNFKLYQDRKSVFTDNWKQYDKVRNIAALQGTIGDDRITSLEGRFFPEKTSQKMKLKINRLLSYATAGLKDKNEQNFLLNKIHFVPHYVKYQEKPGNPKSMDCFNYEMIHPRNFALRQDSMNRTNAIIKLRKENPSIVAKITGIDASSSEIGCRPEVFACSIRKLCSHRQPQNTMSDIVLPQVKRTYHAGEDFLCLLDGLRAIDEAVNFLDMTTGDRLGHALALGVDVDDWYNVKQGKIILSKQDLLDNISWMYGKMQDYGMETFSIEGESQRLFLELFTEIYRKHIPFSARNHSVDINLYYKSWKLRGNDPMLYLHYPMENAYNDIEYLRFVTNEVLLHPWKVIDNRFNAFMGLSAEAILFHHYHFNPDSKYEGAKIVEYHIPHCIITAIKELQKRMQLEIAEKGISIECNPSSNVLIGTFRDYSKHPIIRFFDRNIFDSSENPRLSVSINTDDAGVFETCLENEYALMACALENSRDMNGRKIRPDNVYRWIEDVRQFGIIQSFAESSNEINLE